MSGRPWSVDRAHCPTGDREGRPTLSALVVPALVAAAGPRQRRSERISPGEPHFWRPRQDSNLRTRLRRPVLYPLSYWG